MEDDAMRRCEDAKPTADYAIGDSKKPILAVAEVTTSQVVEVDKSSSNYSTASSGQGSMIDPFENISCPNTFEDNSQIERYFDSHYSTPSPKLRRSKRIARNDTRESVKLKPTKSVQKNVSAPAKTPPKDKDRATTATASTKINRSVAFVPPSVDLPSKLPTTPGPVRNKSLLKMALGNATRKRDSSTPSQDQLTQGPMRRRVRPRTSTPKQNTRLVSKTQTNLVKKVKDITPPVIVEEPRQTSSKEPVLGTVQLAQPTAAVRQTISLRRREQNTRKTIVLRATALPAISRRSVGLQNARPTSTGRQSQGLTTEPAAAAAATTATAAAVSEPSEPAEVPTVQPAEKKRAQRIISKRMAPQKAPERKKSLKSIVKSRGSTSSRTKSAAVRGVTRTAAVGRKNAPINQENIDRTFRKAPSLRAANNNYKHVQSKVAQIINSGPVVPAVRNVKDLKSAAQTAANGVKPRKPLHEKPFLPPGKVHHDTTMFSVSKGDLTIAGQTMAQFVKNFHYQTPPRYRTLKPGENFETTCDNRGPIEMNPTIPKGPKFATNSRLRKATVKK